MSYKIKKNKGVIEEISAWLSPDSDFQASIVYYLKDLDLLADLWYDDGAPIVKAQVIKSKLLQVLYVSK